MCTHICCVLLGCVRDAVHSVHPVVGKWCRGSDITERRMYVVSSVLYRCWCLCPVMLCLPPFVCPFIFFSSRTPYLMCVHPRRQGNGLTFVSVSFLSRRSISSRCACYPALTCYLVRLYACTSVCLFTFL